MSHRVICTQSLILPTIQIGCLRLICPISPNWTPHTSDFKRLGKWLKQGALTIRVRKRHKKTESSPHSPLFQNPICPPTWIRRPIPHPYRTVFVSVRFVGGFLSDFWSVTFIFFLCGLCAKKKLHNDWSVWVIDLRFDGGPQPGLLVGKNNLQCCFLGWRKPNLL